MEKLNWKNLRDGLQTVNTAELEELVKRTKRGNRLKVLAAFGLGSTCGGVVVGYVAYRIFRGLLGGFLRA
jgi:hypothetical protein